MGREHTDLVEATPPARKPQTNGSPLPLHDRRAMEIGRITPPSYTCLRTTLCKQQRCGALYRSPKSVDLRVQRVRNQGNMYAQAESRGTQLYRTIKDAFHPQRPPLGEHVLAQNREGNPPKAPSVVPEGDQHMQAGKGRPVWRKGEAGELFKRIFEETFTSKSKFNHFSFHVKKGVEV